MSAGSSVPPPCRAPTPAHLALAHRLSRRYHCPALSPDDLAQEAVLALLAALQEHGDRPSHLNRAIRWHLAGLVLRSADPAVSLRSDPVDRRGKTSAVSAEVIDAAWECLPPGQAFIVERDAAGDTSDELAARLGISVQAVYRERSRGLARLRQEFA